MQLIKAVYDLRKFNHVGSPYHHEANEIIKNLIASIDLESDANIPSNFKLKLQWYMAECLYSCVKLNTLAGQTFTLQQRESYLLGGALGAMSDVIIDDFEIESERIKEFKKPKKEDQYHLAFEKLYALIYHTFINSLDNDVKASVIHYYELLFDAQIKSKLQFSQTLSQQDVDEICKDKGGYSLLFLRALVVGKITEIEKNAYFQLGAYIQYCNDAQDLYKDVKKGLLTFASSRTSLETIARDLDKQKVIAFFLIKETHFEKRIKDEFLFSLNLMGIGILAKLNRYSKICNGNFSFERLSMKSKEEVRSQLAIQKLLWYSFSKVIKYKYENVEKSFDFQLIE